MPRIPACCWIIALFGLWLSGSAFAQDLQNSKVAIRMKSSTVVTEDRVRLRDVADVIDQDPVRRAHLQDLDLAVFDHEAPMTLDRDFVGIRIQLAGYEKSSLVFTGESKTVITPPVPVSLTDLGIEEAALIELSRQFSVPPEDLHVKLASPFMSNVALDVERLTHPRIEIMRVPQLPLGRTQLMVRILDGEKLTVSRLASFEVARKQNVVVAAMTLERGHQITTHNVQDEVRFVQQPIDRLSAHQLYGRRVMSPLKPGEVLTLRHVGDIVTQEAPILVTAHDPVRLIARKGALTVTIPVAEALQAGRKGQLIRVRNLQSNQIVTGQVTGPGEVMVPLQ